MLQAVLFNLGFFAAVLCPVTEGIFMMHILDATCKCHGEGEAILSESRVFHLQSGSQLVGACSVHNKACGCPGL